MLEKIDKIARRMSQQMITTEYAHYLTARELGPQASSWDVVVALAAGVRRVTGRSA